MRPYQQAQAEFDRRMTDIRENFLRDRQREADEEERRFAREMEDLREDRRRQEAREERERLTRDREEDRLRRERWAAEARERREYRVSQVGAPSTPTHPEVLVAPTVVVPSVEVTPPRLDPPSAIVEAEPPPPDYLVQSLRGFVDSQMRAVDVPMVDIDWDPGIVPDVPAVSLGDLDPLWGDSDLAIPPSGQSVPVGAVGLSHPLLLEPNFEVDFSRFTDEASIWSAGFAEAFGRPGVKSVGVVRAFPNRSGAVREREIDSTMDWGGAMSEIVGGAMQARKLMQAMEEPGRVLATSSLNYIQDAAKTSIINDEGETLSRKFDRFMAVSMPDLLMPSRRARWVDGWTGMFEGIVERRLFGASGK
ncbi:MAG: hypothetical protein R3F29_14865 [Planctomycetota bacterium]